MNFVKMHQQLRILFGIFIQTQWNITLKLWFDERAHSLVHFLLRDGKDSNFLKSISISSEKVDKINT